MNNLLSLFCLLGLPNVFLFPFFIILGGLGVFTLLIVQHIQLYQKLLETFSSQFRFFNVGNHFRLNSSERPFFSWLTDVLLLGECEVKYLIFEFLLALLHDLVEARAYRVTNTFKKLSLLNGDYWKWVLGKSLKHPFVAKCLVPHALEVGIFFQLNELIAVVLVKGIEGLLLYGSTVCCLC